MPEKTASKLEHAKIYEVKKDGTRQERGIEIPCMFNPAEYTVSKQNQFKKKNKQKGTASDAEFQSIGSQSLKLSLMFDTYEAEDKDVSKITRKLWDLMKPKQSKGGKPSSKDKPIQVAFEWGVFRFVAYITNMTQRFTLFTHQGVPVRAKVDVDFVQYTEFEDYQDIPQNPTSGGGPAEQIWQVVAGDRLDNIAAEVYDDTSRWRQIAEYNHLKNPLALRPGQILRIPLE